jgi:hypothetical protein
MLPSEIMTLFQMFAPVVSERIWDWAQVLLVGAILTPKQRTVCAILRVMGLSGERQFQNYHRVLNRARWQPGDAGKRLVQALMAAFLPADTPLVIAADDTLERRRGNKIVFKGLFRDPLLSSRKKNIASPALRWVSLMALLPVPWSRRVWALPFLTLLALHPTTSAQLGRRHKTVIDLVRQAVCLTRRWLPQQPLVLVTDGALISVKLALACLHLPQPVTFVSRLHFNIRLFDPPPPRRPGHRGQPRLRGDRQPTLDARLHDPATAWIRQVVPWYGGGERTVEYFSATGLWHTPKERGMVPLRYVLVRDPHGSFAPAALCCTDPSVAAVQIIAWYVLRWNVEVTFQEVRAHLGMETQRQWNPLALQRVTPALFALFSLVPLLAQQLAAGRPIPTAQTAWYRKRDATFADVLAFVRGTLWRELIFVNSPRTAELVEIPHYALQLLVQTLCYAT